MATSKIKNVSNIVSVKSGTISVPASTVTTVDTVDAPDANAYYLLVIQITPNASASDKHLQIRMIGGNVRGEFRNGIATVYTRVVKGNGSVFTISTHQDTTETQTLNYNFTSIKLI